MPSANSRRSLLVFNSVFAKLFASVMLALVLFALAMMVLTRLVHDTSANTRHQIIASQVTQQLDPLLFELRDAQDTNQALETRYLLALVRRSFNVYSESLDAKFGLYDAQSREAVVTMAGMPPDLPPAPPWFMSLIGWVAGENPNHPRLIQINSQSGYVVLYKARSIGKPLISPALNLATGTLLLLLIIAGVLGLIAHTMTKRINQLSRQIVQLGDGDFSVRVEPSGNDEITLLARGFNQAAERIETLMNANKLLLAHASHEIRTPITRIRLQIEMMSMLAAQLDEKGQEKFAKRAEAINRDLTGLNDLVESILLVSRMDAGHAIEKAEPLDLYELIKNEVQHYPDAKFIGSHLQYNGQKSLLTHLIRNLLDNAHLHGIPPVTVQLYALDAQGHISCQPQSAAIDSLASSEPMPPKPEACEPIPTEPSQDKAADEKPSSKPKSALFSRKKTDVSTLNYHAICIAVIDQGQGIPPEKRQEIFSPFVRLQQEKKGSGLGLSLVSQIVAAHQGTIITDTLDGHTRFLVTLPII